MMKIGVNNDDIERIEVSLARNKSFLMKISRSVNAKLIRNGDTIVCYNSLSQKWVFRILYQSLQLDLKIILWKYLFNPLLSSFNGYATDVRLEF